MPHAHVRHTTRGRVRLQVPSRQHDPEYFAKVGQKLTELEGVNSVRTDSRTGSILVNHDTNLEAIGSFAERHGLFALVTEAATAIVLADRVADHMGDLDQNLVEFTRGQMDLKSLVVLALASGAAVQVFRKNILPPAFTLLWTATALVWPNKPR